MAKNPNLVSVPIVNKNGVQTTVLRRVDPRSSLASSIPRVGVGKALGNAFKSGLIATAIENKLEDKSNLYDNPVINTFERATLGRELLKIMPLGGEAKSMVRKYLKGQKGTTQRAKTLSFIEDVQKVADSKGDEQGANACKAIAVLMDDFKRGEFELLNQNKSWVLSQPDQHEAIIAFGSTYRAIMQQRMELVNHVVNHAEAGMSYMGPYDDYLQDEDYTSMIHENAEKHGTANVTELIGKLNFGESEFGGFTQQDMNKFF